MAQKNSQIYASGAWLANFRAKNNVKRKRKSYKHYVCCAHSRIAQIAAKRNSGAKTA
jgi:hypothetical protein